MSSEALVKVIVSLEELAGTRQLSGRNQDFRWDTIQWIDLTFPKFGCGGTM